jgi:hypothetical protein
MNVLPKICEDEILLNSDGSYENRKDEEDLEEESVSSYASNMSSPSESNNIEKFLQ